MDDLISRQAAIDALEEGFKDATEGVDKLSPTYGLIKAVTGIYKCLIGKLPSAQPEKHTDKRTETHACDSISRREALKKILGQPPEPHYPSWYEEQIKELPPAEPQIIRCGDCVNFRDSRCTVANHHVSEKESCAEVFGAERRTDERSD